MESSKFDEHVQRMWFNGSQPFAEQLAICTLGIAGESGEVAELIKKHVRGDGPVDQTKLLKELGDVLFYITKLGSLHGLTLQQVMAANIEKLESRRARGTFRGNGDDR